MTRKEYIAKYGKYAIESTKGKGLFPSVMMAQAILESSDSDGVPGASVLAKTYNNHFGVKADKEWQGKTINLKTREVYDGKNVIIKDGFRVYDNPLQSFIDRNEFLARNSRYKAAGVFNAKTPEEQADALQRARYATDPNYANTLKALIRTLKLKELDDLAKKNESSDSGLSS